MSRHSFKWYPHVWYLLIIFTRHSRCSRSWFPNDPMFTAKESLQDLLQSHVHLSVAKTIWESNQKPQCHLCHRTWWTHDQWPKWILYFCNSFMIMHVLTYFTPSFCTEYENSTVLRHRLPWSVRPETASVPVETTVGGLSNHPMFRISGLTMIDPKPTLHSQTTRYHFRYFRRPNGCNCKRPKLQVALFLQISFATLPNQQHKQNLQQSFPRHSVWLTRAIHQRCVRFGRFPPFWGPL